LGKFSANKSDLLAPASKRTVAAQMDS
jgi:hypothetical protein